MTERSDENDPSTLSLVTAAIAGAMIVFAVFGYAASADEDAFETPVYRTGAAAVGGAFAGDYASGGGTLVLSSSGEARAAGDVQQIDVDVSGDRFVPNYIHVRAGVPVAMRFSAGARGAQGVRIERLGIAADLSGGRHGAASRTRSGGLSFHEWPRRRLGGHRLRVGCA